MSNDTLPIAAYRDKIIDAVRKNPVVILTAETGAGKSTQVPQFLLEEGYDIVVTQPRRLAARTVSARVAEEHGISLGDVIGFRTAYEWQDSEATRCLFVTDGLALVRELMGHGPQVLVIDEVHERNMNIDVLMAWAKYQSEQGVDFKLVLMSATLEADRLSRYFDNAPIINVPGRSFPVEDRAPTGNSLEDDVVTLLRQGHNILVFEPGKREIDETIQHLQRVPGLNAEILPLHGGLTPEEQAKCFRSYNRPKCVVSTNVAQTSITISDIDAVVDSGLERRIELVDGVEGLYLKAISLTDRQQRMGRAGRTKSGIYIDWCPIDETQRLDFPKPEILRVRLDQAVLRLAEAGIDMEKLEFLDQPEPVDIHEAKRALIALGCMDADGNVTKEEMREGGIFVKAYFQAKEKRKHLANALKGKVKEFASSGHRENILKAVCAGMVDHLYRSDGYGQLQNGDDARTLGRESVVQSAQWLVGQPWDLQIQTRYGPRVLLLVKMASRVEPTWLAEVAPQLIEVKTGLNPRYDPDQTEVVSTTETWFNGQLVKSQEILDPNHPAAIQLRRDGKNLWQWENWHNQPAISLPDPLDDNSVVPEIVTGTYGTNSEDGTPLLAYGTAVVNTDRWHSSHSWFKVTWTRDQDEARRLYEVAVSRLLSIRIEAKADAERARRATELQDMKAQIEPVRVQIMELYRTYGHGSNLSDELRRKLYDFTSLPYMPSVDQLQQWQAKAEAIFAEASAAVAKLGDQRKELTDQVTKLQHQAADILDQHRDLLSYELDADLVRIEEFEPDYVGLDELQRWVTRAQEQVESAKLVTQQTAQGGVSDDAMAMLKGRFGSH